MGILGKKFQIFNSACQNQDGNDRPQSSRTLRKKSKLEQ